MRTTDAATAALTLALTGSLALGISGTAAAVTHHTTGVTGATSTPRDADDTDDADDADGTARQIRTIKDLGRLAELTGRLGRVTHDEDAASTMARDVQKRVNRQVRRVLEAVEQDRPARTLPANDDDSRVRTRTVTVSDASNSFRQSVQRIVNVGHGDTKSRTAATDALLKRLSGVNTAAMDEIGLSTTHERKLPQRTSSPRAAITTTLIDRDTLDSGSSDRLGRYDDATDAIGELIEDVYESRDGRLSSAEAAGHSRDLNEALSALRHGASTRERSRVNTGTVDDLVERADALLKATRTGSARDIRTDARRLMDATPELFATMPTASSASAASWDMAADEDEDDELQWTGMVLSPMVR